MENNDILEFDSLCDKVRFAVSVGDELTEEMNKHLESCEECRTFLEQSNKMTEVLGTMGVDTFTKDGKSVADCVMEEIKRQELFTKGKPVKTVYRSFRHMGLVAACLIIAVMAFPVMNGVFTPKDAALENTNDSAVYIQETPEEEPMSAQMAKNGFEVKASGSSEAVLRAEHIELTEDGLMTTLTGDKAEPESDDTGVVEESTSSENAPMMMFKALPKKDAVVEMTEAELGEEMLNSSVNYSSDSYREYDAMVLGEEQFENIDDAALYGAESYLNRSAKIIAESVSLSYTDSGGAFAVFETYEGFKITVYLKKQNELWSVIEVCEGDITE